MDDRSLAGRRIGITADRRWEEQAALLERRGATVVHGPTLRTLDLRDDERLRAVTRSLVDDPPEWFVATTGLGMRRWLEAATAWGVADGLLAALGGARVVARGAKSASAVRQAGLEVSWRAPRETMDEVVDHLREAGPVRARVALQLFDPDDHPSTTALRALVAPGALVEVPVYRWLPPDDRAPAVHLVEEAVAGRLDAVTFTSQPAVRFLFRIAADLGRADRLREVMAERPVLAACVGPVCAKALVEEGVSDPLWPEPNRLPPMVRLLAERLGAAH